MTDQLPAREKSKSPVPPGYPKLLQLLKSRIRSAQIQAIAAANHQLLALYHSIGRELHIRTQSGAWGSSVIDRLALDLQKSFPSLNGFSPRNLRRMRAFFQAYPDLPHFWPPTVAKSDSSFWPPTVANLPWAHHVILLEKCKQPQQRLWYAQAAIEHGWTRNLLALQIDSNLHARRGKAVTNFESTLPKVQSDLAQEVLKDPYIFDFISIHENTLERDLENNLLSHITKFLLELGAGFAFVGQQYRIAVDNEDYFIDLLFYHVRLHCFVVVDLKTGPFKPEFAGKMNFYLSAVDDSLRSPADQPTIGLILCRDNRRLTAEYALRDIAKPIGVAGWKTKITEALPKYLQGSLPTVKQLETELNKKSATQRQKSPPHDPRTISP